MLKLFKNYAKKCGNCVRKMPISAKKCAKKNVYLSEISREVRKLFNKNAEWRGKLAKNVQKVRNLCMNLRIICSKCYNGTAKFLKKCRLCKKSAEM